MCRELPDRRYGRSAVAVQRRTRVGRARLKLEIVALSIEPRPRARGPTPAAASLAEYLRRVSGRFANRASRRGRALGAFWGRMTGFRRSSNDGAYECASGFGLGCELNRS